MSERLRCIRRTEVYDAQGRPEKNRRIDAGDICLVGQAGSGGLIPVEYPVKTGTRRACVRDPSAFAPGWRVYNQNAYGHVAYPAPGYESATVKSGGCGVTAMAMAVENLVLGMLDPAACAGIALQCGARVSGGTDLHRLGRHLCTLYPMEMTASASVEALRQCMARGGIAVVNTGGDRGSHKGIFSSGGHYVAVLELEGDTALVADPGYYAGKYSKSWRRGVQVEGGLLRCSLSLLEKDSANRYPPYYLFERRQTA